MKRWDWGIGIGIGVGIGFGIGVGVGIGIGIGNREPSADSRKRIAETGEWGFGNGDWGLRNHVYKKGCEKNGHHFFTALFYILYQLVRDLMGAGIFPPRLMNSSARNLLISRIGA